jgi:hypothetical protein
MANFLDRATDWRRRAKELRITAEGMTTPVAQSSLLDMAAAVEHHAENLEQIIFKLRSRGRQAGAVHPFREFVLRRSDVAAKRCGS